jgi:hypothetical protein
VRKPCSGEPEEIIAEEKPAVISYQLEYFEQVTSKKGPERSLMKISGRSALLPCFCPG